MINKNMSESSKSNKLLVNVDPRGVMRITLNIPERHNAFDDHQAQRIIMALERARDDEAIRVVVLAGEGSSFSAGGDLNYMKRMASNTFQENLDDAGQLARLMKLLDTLPLPTVARVHGATFGGGVGLVSCCDIAIGSPKAKFALSEVKVGMAPATIAPYVVRTIGTKAARRFFTTAEIITADKALSLGLLSEVVAEQELDSNIETVVAALLANGPTSIKKAKQIVFDVAEGEIDEEMIAHTVKFIADIRNSDEAREGLSAFLEKRKPKWIQGG